MYVRQILYLRLEDGEASSGALWKCSHRGEGFAQEDLARLHLLSVHLIALAHKALASKSGYKVKSVSLGPYVYEVKNSTSLVF